MPMVYMPNAGDVVIFLRKRGILVRSLRYNCLSFLAIDNAGKVTADSKHQNRERNFFNSAVPLSSNEDVSKAFAVAVNAIKAVPAAATPL